MKQRLEKQRHIEEARKLKFRGIRASIGDFNTGYFPRQTCTKSAPTTGREKHTE